MGKEGGEGGGRKGGRGGRRKGGRGGGRGREGGGRALYNQDTFSYLILRFCLPSHLVGVNNVNLQF